MKKYYALRQTIKDDLERHKIAKIEKTKEQSLTLKITPFGVTNWLFKKHQQMGLTPALEHKCYYRGAKKFIETYGKENCRFLLAECDKRLQTEYPFTFKFVTEFCEGIFDEYDLKKPVKIEQKELF